MGAGFLVMQACCDSAVRMHICGYRSWSCSAHCREPFWFHRGPLKRSGLLWEAVHPMWLCTWDGSPFPLLPAPWREPMPCTKPEWSPGSHSSLLCNNSLFKWFVWWTSNSVRHIACTVSWRKNNYIPLRWRVNLCVCVLKMNSCTVLEAGWNSPGSTEKQE